MLRSRSRPGLISRNSGGVVDSPVFSADYFGYDGSTFAWYGSPTGDNAFYDATGNKTWTCYESWSGTKRIVYVTIYDHATSLWSDKYQVCISNIANDDHGVPAMIMDANGRVHVFFGPHNGPMQYAVTTNVRDPSNWTIRPNFTGGEYSYPHPIKTSSGIALLMRKRTTGLSKSTGAYQKSTAISGSTVTWQAEKIFADLGTDSRYYIGSVIAVGDEIHMIVTRADFNDNYRVDLYYIVLDTATDTLKNFDGSYTVASGSWPVNLADHNTYFRIYTHAVSYSGNVPSMCFDNNGYPHILFNNYTGAGPWLNSDLLYMNWNGSAWSTPEVVGANSYRYDDSSITHNGSGVIQILYPYDGPSDNVIRGGDMYIRTRSAGGVWDTASIIRNQELPYGLDRAKNVFNADPNLRWVFLEAAPSFQHDGIDGSSDLKAGYQRVFAYGDSGIKGRTVTKTVSLSATQISDGRGIGDTVAIINSDNQRNTYTITSDPDSKFSISGNLLKLAATINLATKATHSVTIRAELRGKSVTQTFTLNVIAADSLVDKMICEFPLNEASGQIINDASPRGLDGYLSFGPTANHSTDPTWETAGLLFGTTGNKFASVPAADFLTSSNLHIFVAARNSGTSTAPIVNRRGFNGTSEQYWSLAAENRKLKVLTYNASGSIVANVTTAADVMVDNTWHQIEVIFNGTALTIRVGGVDVATNTMSAALVSSGKTGPLNIGSFFTDTTNYNGRIGYVSLFNAELTGSELTAARARLSAAMLAKGVTV